MIKGMDISTLTEVESCGGKFYKNGVQGDALEILKSYGANMIRLRLWNDPFDENGNSYGAGGCDLETILKLAKRVKNAGLEWMLVLHYSDFWADPGKQTPPKAWKSLDADGLEKAVYEYTLQTLKKFQAEGVSPAIVSVGNEITNGFLWPHGKTPDFSNIARFVNAGLRAVKEVDPDAKTMIHLDNGGRNDLYRNWFDNYFKEGGMQFDYIGLSYYPFWHGTMQGLRDNMNDIAVRYNKDLIITETSTAFTFESYSKYEKLEEDQRKGGGAKVSMEDRLEYPVTPEGQSDFIKAVMETVSQVPNGHGKGVFWWEPAWVPVPGSGWANKAGWEYVNEKGPGGNEWANQALFDYEGNALPALETIRTFE